MVYKVVSTKLSEDEHEKLLDMYNQEGLTPSALIKESILMRIDPDFSTQGTYKIQQKEPVKKVTE